MKKIFDIIKKEQERQQNEICLIASENYTYKEVMKAQGSCLTNRYAEGYPNARYYGGCEHIDQVETTAIEEAKSLFKCKFANVQPHSGSQANQAVYLSCLKPGDTLLGMGLDAGGHLTHGAKASSSGKLYNAIPYGLDENGILNYNEIEEKLYKYNPKLLVIGASAYPRTIDFKRIRKILDKYNKAKPKTIKKIQESDGGKVADVFDTEIPYCYMMVDMAHIAGLVAAKLHQSPLKYADIVTSTTHKTLRGPRGGLILWNNEEFTKKLNSAVFPGGQGGPLEHIIAAKAICFNKAKKSAFRKYSVQVLKNIKAMEQVFSARGVKMVTGGSDNHLLLLDFKDKPYTGKQVESALEKNGIIANKNAVVGDTRNRFETSGLRIGTACITARGMKEVESIQIANRICEILHELETDTTDLLEHDKWEIELKRLTTTFKV